MNKHLNRTFLGLGIVGLMLLIVIVLITISESWEDALVTFIVVSLAYALGFALDKAFDIWT